MFCSANRWTLRVSDSASTTVTAKPSWSCKVEASRVDSRVTELVTPPYCHPLVPDTSLVVVLGRYPRGVAGVAQLAEAAGLGPACWGFESLHRHSAYLRLTNTSSSD